LQQSEQVLRDAVQRNPGNTDLSVALADVLFSEQKDDKADQVLGQLRLNHKDRADVSLALGDLFLQRHKLDRAFDEYRRGLDSAPGNTELQHRIVECYLVSGDVSNAVLWNGKILQQNPKDLTANIARARVLLAQGKVSDAATILREQVDEARDSAQARYYLSVALWRRGDVNNAKSELQQTLRLSPDMPAPYMLWPKSICLWERDRSAGIRGTQRGGQSRGGR